MMKRAVASVFGFALALGSATIGAAEEIVGKEIPEDAAALGQQILGYQPVYILVVAKDGQAFLWTCGSLQNCTTSMPTGLQPGPSEWYMWEKFKAPGDPDPCTTWKSSTGTNEERCW